MDTNEHKLRPHYMEIAQFRAGLILSQSIGVYSWFVVLRSVFLRGPLWTILSMFHVEHWFSLMPLTNSRCRLQGTRRGAAQATPGTCRNSPFQLLLVVNTTTFSLP